MLKFSLISLALLTIMVSFTAIADHDSKKYLEECPYVSGTPCSGGGYGAPHVRSALPDLIKKFRDHDAGTHQDTWDRLTTVHDNLEGTRARLIEVETYLDSFFKNFCEDINDGKFNGGRSKTLDWCTHRKPLRRQVQLKEE